MGARLSPGDSQRQLRAWEVLEATGRSLAEQKRSTEVGQAAFADALTDVLLDALDVCRHCFHAISPFRLELHPKDLINLIY